MVGERVNYESLNNEYADRDSLQYRKLQIIDSYIPKGIRLLDIGAGTGELINLEAHKFNEIYGIDVDSESIRICQQRVKNNTNIHIFETDLKNYDHIFGDKKFDCITCLDVLEHVTLTECKSILRTIYDLTNRSGLFIFTAPGIFEKARIFLGLSPTHLHSHSSYGWMKMIKDTGFTIVSVETVAFPLMDNELLRKKIHLFGKCCLIVSKKTE